MKILRKIQQKMINQHKQQADKVRNKLADYANENERGLTEIQTRRHR